MNDETPIYDALARMYGQPHPTLYDSIAERMANAYLSDDVLVGQVIDRWATEVAAADVLRLWDGGDLDE